MRMRMPLGLLTILLGAVFVVAASPQIAVDNDTHVFGQVVEGTFIRHSFVLTNVGDQVLTIEEARSVSTCPCTTVKLHDVALAPGEDTRFDVVWDTAGYGGRTSGWSFFVASDDPETPTLYVSLQGEIVRAGPNHLPIQNLGYDLYLLVDLRSPEAYAEEHILGAINIPFESLDDYIGLLSYEHLIIFYDQDGSESVTAVGRMLEGGYQQHYVVNLHGGLSAWTAAQGATWSSDPFVMTSSRDGSSTTPSRFGDHTITVQWLQRWFFAMIDVRLPDEYARGHLAGAINIPFDQLDDHLDLLPVNARLIVYDERGVRSEQAVEKLVDRGITRAQTLVGGISLWREAFGTTMIWPVQ